jgi:hypothetical protein
MDEGGTHTSGTEWDGNVQPITLDRNNNPIAWGMMGPEVLVALRFYNALDLCSCMHS